MTIIRDAKKLAEASTADLIETYNAFSDTPVKRFADRTIALRRTEMALLAGVDRAGHAGVKPGAAIVPMAVAEAQTAPSGQPEPVQEPSAPDPQANPYPPGSKRAELFERAAASPKPAKRPEAPPREPGAPRVAKVVAVELTGEGRSKMQAASARAAVFSGAQTLAAASGGRVDVDALEKHCGVSVRGHVQKLIALGHLRAVA